MAVTEGNGTNGRSGKVRYAVVGVGWISQAAFLPGVGHTENSEVVALVTSDDIKAQKVGELYGIAKTYTYAEYESMLASARSTPFIWRRQTSTMSTMR